MTVIFSVFVNEESNCDVLSVLPSSGITPPHPPHGTDQDRPGALPKVDTEGTDSAIPVGCRGLGWRGSMRLAGMALGVCRDWIGVV